MSCDKDITIRAKIMKINLLLTKCLEIMEGSQNLAVAESEEQA